MATNPTNGDFTETIETAAVEPAQASGDGVSMSNRSISELIEADRYLAAKRAAAQKHGGLRFAKIQPGGASSTSVSGQ